MACPSSSLSNKNLVQVLTPYCDAVTATAFSTFLMYKPTVPRWVHQDRASLFASGFFSCRPGKRKKIYAMGISVGPFWSQRKSPFASDFHRKEIAHLDFGVKNTSNFGGQAAFSFWELKYVLFLGVLFCLFRRRANVQQLTCNIALCCYFYYLFFSFVLIELKPFVSRGKSWGKHTEKVREVRKLWKILKRVCPLVVAL